MIAIETEDIFYIRVGDAEVVIEPRRKRGLK